MAEWWQSFFDEDMLDILYGPQPYEKAEEKAGAVCGFIERILSLEPGVSILDLACGPGFHVAEFARRGYRVTGLDYSKFFLEKARERLIAANLTAELVHSDMRDLSARDRFDVVINLFTSFGYFEDENDHLKVLRAVNDALRPGGALFIDMVCYEWLLRHFQRFDWRRIGDTVLLEERDLEVPRSRINTKWMLIKKGSAREYSHSLRLFTLGELTSLLKSAGLEPEAYYGAIDQPWTIDNHRTMIVARKK